ncbi:hypothetical protein [Dysgonomonas sp.]
MKNNNLIIFALLAAVVAFFLGFQTKKNEAEISGYVVEKGLNMATNEIKSQAGVTKNWFNQLTNQWKQIWS